MSPRAELIGGVAACVAGAALVLLAAEQPWAAASITGLPGRPEVGPTGADLAPAVSGLGLAALAGGLAVIATRRAARTLVGVFLVLAGLGIVTGPVRVATDLDGSLREPAAEAAGHSSPAIAGERMTGWPAVAGAGGVLVAAAGAATVVRGRRWPSMSGRYEPRDGSRNERPDSLWEAISRGDDPTT